MWITAPVKPVRAAVGCSAALPARSRFRLDDDAAILKVFAHLPDDLVLADDAVVEQFLHEYADDRSMSLAMEAGTILGGLAPSNPAAESRSFSSVQSIALVTALQSYVTPAASDLKVR